MSQKILLESQFWRCMLHHINAGTANDTMESKVSIAACSISLMLARLALIIVLCSDLLTQTHKQVEVSHCTR